MYHLDKTECDSGRESHLVGVGVGLSEALCSSARSLVIAKVLVA